MLLRGLIAAVTLLAFPATASADVLVQHIPRRLTCGDPINPGIWAQPQTRGDRRVRMKAIDRRSGKVWWRRTARATTRRWREWYLPSGMDGQCRPTTFVYAGPGWRARYRITFRPEPS